MPAPTVAVTVKLSSLIGEAIEGATVKAKLDRYEVYQQIVVADDVTGTTDANGECVLDLFPNALPTNDPPGLGSQGSVYQFTITGTGGKKVNVQAVIPNQACDLHDVIVAEEPGAPSTGEIVGAVRYNIAQTLSAPQQAQARANIGFDAAVRAVALTGLSLATATAIAATDTALVAFGKAQAQITALDATKANLSGAAFSGAVSATSFTGPLTGNVTGNVSGTAGSVAASAITGTTLAANVVTSSLTAVGTIATGVWQGTAIADTYLATISTGGKVANSATTATSANTASAIVARDSSGNFTAGTITAALTGNASTATTLQTARTINGVSFNGSANITVAAAAGTLTGATLPAGVTASSLTSVGTLTALTVSGTSTLGVTRISAADASSPMLGISGTTKGIRFACNSTDSRIEALDNTLAASYQPLLIIASAIGAYTSGTSAIALGTNNGTNQAYITHTASAVNQLTFTGSATGQPTRIGNFGSDANPDILIAPQGTGVLRFGTHSALAAETVTGYITIKDSGGTTRKLAVVS